MNIKKNDDVVLEIIDYTADGVGLGKIDGLAIFVPGTVVGDLCDVHIIKTAKNYCVGKLSKIKKPSKHRIENDCLSFAMCGGCAFRNISYDFERKIKQKRVKDCIERIGGLSIEPKPIVFDGNLCRYRNKAQFKLEKSDNGIMIGFYANHTHRVTECRQCLLHPVEFETAAHVFVDFLEEKNISIYDETTGKGLVRQLYLRRGAVSGELMVCVVVNGNRFFDADELCKRLKEALPELKSVVVNINREKTNTVLGAQNTTIYGTDTINDEMCGLKFRLSPHSFYQVNTHMAQRLFEKAAEYASLTGNETVIDLFCGAGAIGLSMAKKARRIIGVEIVSAAVENAKENAKQNGIENCEFICADAKNAARDLAKRNIKPDVVIIDPPRKGCDCDLIETITNDFCPDRVVYVSCDPATLARDLKIFGEKGYAVQEITPFDLFPRTRHIETVVKLSGGDVNTCRPI